MFKRIVTGVVLLAIVFALIYFQGWYLRCGLLFMTVVALHEVYNAFANKGIKPVRWPSFLFAAAAFASEAFPNALVIPGDTILLMAIMLCVMASIMCVVLRGQPDFEAIAASTVPILYPGMFFAFFMRIQSLGHPGVVTLALFMTILVSAMNDTFALFTGKAFGKHKLIPGISPNKTIEGAVGGLIASAVFAVAIPMAFVKINETYALWPDMPALAPMWVFAVFGVIAGIISMIGDLAASLLKRWCGIKDYGKIFPGHGGMMDRLDAIMFTAVATYLFFMLTGH